MVQFPIEVRDRFIVCGKGFLLVKEGVLGDIDLDPGFGGRNGLDCGNDLPHCLQESGVAGGVETDDFYPFGEFRNCLYNFFPRIAGQRFLLLVHSRNIVLFI